MNKIYTFVLPGQMIVGVKKPKLWRLNLNVYRNTQSMLLGNIKQKYSKLLSEKYPFKRFDATKIRVKYIVKSNRNGRKDLNNLWVIVDKFFCDWLVEEDYIPDDSVDNVFYAGPEWGGVDKELPCNTIFAEVEVLL